jgi:hypothetical protein
MKKENQEARFSELGPKRRYPHDNRKRRIHDPSLIEHLILAPKRWTK